MSQENVESLRAFFETWDPWEWARGEGMSLLDPEVIYEASSEGLPDQAGETYRGHEGVARATRTWLEPIEEGGTFELERIVGSGDSLVSIVRACVTARHTGIELAVVWGILWKFRDGKVIHFKAFISPEEALKAAGLEE